MGIFKTKPGGTFFGNLIRTTANKFSGGVLGNGAMINNASAGGMTQAAAINNLKDVAASAVENSPEAKKAIAKGIWDKYKPYLIGGFSILFVAVVTYLLTRKKKYSAQKRRF